MTEPHPDSTNAPGEQSLLADIAAAFLLLSRIPVFWHRFPSVTPPDFVSALWAFPLVGYVIGGVGGAVLVLTTYAGLPPLVAAAVGLFAVVMLSGAMHEDGLADMADGFGGGHDVESKIRIMHDSRIGSYGVVALILAMAARIGLLIALTMQLSGLQLVGLIAVFHAAARFQPVMQLAIFTISPHAKLAMLTGRPDAGRLVAGAFVWMLPLIWLAAFQPVPLLIIMVPVLFCSLGIGYLATRQVGGITGDVMGGTIVLAEMTLMSSWLIALQWGFL